MRVIINLIRLAILLLIGAVFLTGMAEQEICSLFCIAFLVIAMFYIIVACLCRYLPWTWACNWAGTHFPSKDGFFDGCSIHSKCRKCGKEIMQDGQGNWF